MGGRRLNGKVNGKVLRRSSSSTTDFRDVVSDSHNVVSMMQELHSTIAPLKSDIASLSQKIDDHTARATGPPADAATSPARSRVRVPPLKLDPNHEQNRQWGTLSEV